MHRENRYQKLSCHLMNHTLLPKWSFRKNFCSFWTFMIHNSTLTFELNKLLVLSIFNMYGGSRSNSFCVSQGIYRTNSLPTLPMEREESMRRKQRGDSVFTRKCCESTKICWWEPDPEYPNSTVDFCLDTSLHGMKYICQPQRHLTER